MENKKDNQSEAQEKFYVLETMILGGYVGKTAFIERLMNNKFDG